jgi:hypothetical protein
VNSDRETIAHSTATMCALLGTLLHSAARRTVGQTVNGLTVCVLYGCTSYSTLYCFIFGICGADGQWQTTASRSRELWTDWQWHQPSDGAREDSLSRGARRWQRLNGDGQLRICISLCYPETAVTVFNKKRTGLPFLWPGNCENRVLYTN